MQEIQVWSLGPEDPLEEGMATHSSILALRIPWTDRSLAGYIPWGHTESDTTEHTRMEGYPQGMGCVICAHSLSHVKLFVSHWTVATRLLRPWGLQVRILKWVVIPFSNPWIETKSPALQVDSLPSEPSAKPRYTQIQLQYSLRLYSCDLSSIDHMENSLQRETTSPRASTNSRKQCLTFKLNILNISTSNTKRKNPDSRKRPGLGTRQTWALK